MLHVVHLLADQQQTDQQTNRYAELLLPALSAMLIASIYQNPFLRSCGMKLVIINAG
jgi:hypothetical protein